MTPNTLAMHRCDICGGTFDGPETDEALLCPVCHEAMQIAAPIPDDTIPAMLASLACATAQAAKVCEAQGHRMKAWELTKQAKVQQQMATDQQAMEDGLRAYAAASKRIFGALLPEKKEATHATH